MEFNYSKLEGRMKEKQFTQEKLAILLKISPPTLSLKLNNKSLFSQDEISQISDIIEIPKNEIGVYFFTPKV